MKKKKVIINENINDLIFIQEKLKIIEINVSKNFSENILSKIEPYNQNFSYKYLNNWKVAATILLFLITSSLITYNNLKIEKEENANIEELYKNYLLTYNN